MIFFLFNLQDFWDSIENNNYFSLEGLWNVVKQVYVLYFFKFPLESYIGSNSYWGLTFTVENLQDSWLRNTQISDTEKDCKLWGQSAFFVRTISLIMDYAFSNNLHQVKFWGNYGYPMKRKCNGMLLSSKKNSYNIISRGQPDTSSASHNLMSRQ